MAARRPYRLKARAERQEQTKLRITKATVELHATIGPARTTVTAVAERAGVDRLTVYRHFPSQRELFTACSSHAQASDPPPDPTGWTATDPAARLREALEELYGYYERNAGLLANVLRDSETMPLVRELSAPRRLYLERAADVLLRGWKARGRRRALLGAAVAHALEFTTWRSLVRGQGLSNRDAARLMTATAAAAHAAAELLPAG